MFSDFLSQYSTTVDPRTLLVKLLVAMVLGYAVSLLYLNTIGSKDKRLARLFPIMAMATTLASTLIASSLGIALGLVGAMSIVRFRNIMPGLEQSAFLFLTIGVGLASGTGHPFTAFLALAIIAPVFYFHYRWELSKGYLVELMVKGDQSRIESFLENPPVQIPGLRLASMEQEGTQAQYRFTFPSREWEQVLQIQRKLSGQTGLQISLSPRNAPNPSS